MRTLKLILAYDGTNYAGWQRQANALSVQEVLEAAFAPLIGGPDRPSISAAGRTDAGVHAMGQVASLRVGLDLPADAIGRALNVRLPPDVRVLDVAEMPSTFHARFDARGKTYEYRIATGPVLLPFQRWFVWHVPQMLDVDRMRHAAEALVGRHDFVAFQARGAAVVDTVRTIHRLTIDAADAAVRVEVEGDGFLRHMVRAMVGSLVDVGTGLRPPNWIPEILASRDRRQAGPTAPAAGLTLLRVRY